MKTFIRISLGLIGILVLIGFFFVFAASGGIEKTREAASSGYQSVGEFLNKDDTAPNPAPSDDNLEDDEEVESSESDEIVLLGEGTYVNGFQEAEECYEITQSDLNEWSGDNTLILFEGELCDALSVHQIMIVDEPFEINQGSFWSFETGKGDLAEDVLMAFAHDKWQNWQSQGITSLPIIVHLPNGGQRRFSNGEEPTLSEGQQELVEQNEDERCPSGNEPVEQTPFSDSEGENQVNGAPGSFACMTLYVPGEDTAAIGYFLGAWDEFPYPAQGAKFYLAPKDWTAQDVQNWAGTRSAIKLR